MYEQIINDIKQDFYAQNFSNDGHRFVAWYLRNIHLRDMIETKDDMIDGKNDKQIDAIVIDDNKQSIFIIQGKFIGENSIDSEPLREVFAAWMHLHDLVKLQEVSNLKLKRKISELAKALEDEYEIVFELVITGKLTDAANKDLATFQKYLVDLSENEDFDATINLIDKDEIRRRYDLALEIDNPAINHIIDLKDTHYLKFKIADTKIVLASIPLKKCISIPGIKDGTLFRKNVRQSLGLNNRVNKGIRSTIYGEKHKDFFFFHNGITAICNEITLENEKLQLKSLSVVNGCQSLTTILNCSEKVKELKDISVLFRFYEIPQRDRADKISINTNSQSSVKPRDLRSNDKRVLNLKKIYEQKYKNGYFITKRGEAAPADKDKTYILDLSDLGKFLIAWHSQRPNISYSEAKIFDKYFEQLFKRVYTAEDAQSLYFWMQNVQKRWVKENPLGLNESLLVMRSYAPYHHLYAISFCFCILNKMPESVPKPSVTYEKAKKNDLIDQIVNIAGCCLNSALEAAANEPLPSNRVFSPQNWIKTKSCLSGIRAAIRQYFTMLPSLPSGKEINEKLFKYLKMETNEFETRWAAD